MLNDISFVIFRMIIALDLYNQAAVLNECASKTFSQSSFFIGGQTIPVLIKLYSIIKRAGHD